MDWLLGLSSLVHNVEKRDGFEGILEVVHYFPFTAYTERGLSILLYLFLYLYRTFVQFFCCRPVILKQETEKLESISRYAISV